MRNLINRHSLFYITFFLFFSLHHIVCLTCFGQTTVSKNAKAEMFFQKGIKYLINHDLEPAEKMLLKALALDPSNGRIHWETGWVYWEKKEWKKTITHWDMTRQYSPEQEDLDKYYNIALQYLDRENRVKDQPVFFKSPALWKGSRPGEIAFTCVGDIMMGSDFRGVSNLPRENGNQLFDGTRTVLKGDIVFGNLEGPLTTARNSTKPAHKKKYYIFRTPPEYAKTLKNAGLTIVGLANNHINDFGPKGIKETTLNLDKQGIHYFGHTGHPYAIVETNNIKIGFLGVSTNYYCVSINNLTECISLVRQMRKSTDLVVVSFHAGAEGISAAHTPRKKEFFYGELRGDVRKFSHAMIDEGADLVIGHGPHALRGIEHYKGKAIFYSLGNFLGYLSFSTSGDLKYSAVFNVILTAQGKLKKVNVIPLILNHQAVPAIDPKGYSILLLNELSRTDFGENALLLDKNGEWEF